MLAMPAALKRAHMLEKVVEYHGQWKWACISYLASQLLDDLPSLDPQTNTDSSRLSSSSSSLSLFLSSSHSSQSSLSSDLSGSSCSTMHIHSRHSFSGSFEDSDNIKIILFKQWNTQIQSLALYLLTAWVLNTCPHVKKSGQLDLYLINFWQDHPDWFWKKLCVSPPIFDCLVELIEGHNIFHNNLNTPQHPILIQLAIFLICVKHYGNASLPEYVAQWAGVCVRTVINVTYRCLVAFLALYDEAVMMLPEKEKECAKQYVEEVTCPEWQNGFLLADGTKFILFQKLRLHGEAWFNKNKKYSIDCQVHSNSLRREVILTCTLPPFRSSVCHKVYWSLTTHWVTQAVCMMHGHSEALECLRTMRKYLGKANGCGQTVYTPETWSVAPFKKPINEQLTADQRTYNYWVSKVSYVSCSKLNELHYLQIHI